jgi:hypothetical protein
MSGGSLSLRGKGVSLKRKTEGDWGITRENQYRKIKKKRETGSRKWWMGMFAVVSGGGREEEGGRKEKREVTGRLDIYWPDFWGKGGGRH